MFLHTRHMFIFHLYVLWHILESVIACLFNFYVLHTGVALQV